MNGRTLASLVLGMVFVAPVMAHHSFASFDPTRQVTLVGVVKKFSWGNPHTWIYIDVPAGDQIQEWEIEGGPTGILRRDGWTKDSIKVGDKLTLTIFPKRDGSYSGAFVQAITPSGKTLGHADDKLYTPSGKSDVDPKPAK